MKYAIVEPKQRKGTKRDPERLEELLDKSCPTFEEFLEISSLAGGPLEIAKRLGMTKASIYNMGSSGRTKIYYERYCAVVGG